MKKFLAFLLIAFVFAGVPAAAVAQTKVKNTRGRSAAATSAESAPRFGNTDGITAAQMKNYLEFIASDALEGRDTPSRGLDIAAMYIADHLRSWGIKPAGDNGTYFQRFPLKRHRIDAPKTRLELGGQEFAYGEDFLSTTIPADIAKSEVVYASHGWVLKSKNINPYEGLDVRNKIVVVVNSLPKDVTFQDLKGKPGDDWFSPPLYAQTHGARAVIAFGSFGNLASWRLSHYDQTEKGSLEFGTPETKITVPTITAHPRLIAALFQGERANGSNVFTKAITKDFVAPFALDPNKKIDLRVSVKSENLFSQNVVGILEGSDPVLKNEYVAVGAHYDHVGMNPFISGADKIWNGADDDGSGTVAVMAMAEAFARGAERPKRSILFIWHAGEEKGLWGSEYYANNPTVPITSIITQLNIDMIGRAQKRDEEVKPRNQELIKTGDVYLIGSKMMSTELGLLSEAVNNSFLKMGFNYRYDAPDDPQQFFYRSDHFNYAKKGIPIIFYMDGDHEDYHQPSDSIEKIDFEQMERVARTIFATAWELATRPTRPKVDKPLPAAVTGN